MLDLFRLQNGRSCCCRGEFIRLTPRIGNTREDATNCVADTLVFVAADARVESNVSGE
jgi:hypothetical protein